MREGDEAEERGRRQRLERGEKGRLDQLEKVLRRRQVHQGHVHRPPADLCHLLPEVVVLLLQHGVHHVELHCGVPQLRELDARGMPVVLGARVDGVVCPAEGADPDAALERAVRVDVRVALFAAGHVLGGGQVLRVHGEVLHLGERLDDAAEGQPALILERTVHGELVEGEPERHGGEIGRPALRLPRRIGCGSRERPLRSGH
mmetsp:Transcript_68432/g.216568  ORF Transcript_68432/g.216568 Transcript_68432/m.216568 type:complete len:203 (+) Transcript_68432:306-914(+)